jgi:predicted amidophosphoribosyltransferase
MLCSSCVAWQAEIDRMYSPFRFEGVIRQAIHEFKYRNLHAIVLKLAQLLSTYLVENPISCDVLIPVPLHNKRLRERGHNQSGLLAKESSRLTGLKVNKDYLMRGRHNLPQAKTGSVEERRQNVMGFLTVVMMA